MKSPDQLFASLTSGFDDPLDMLQACHERIRRHCDLICRLADRVARRGVGDEVCTAARHVLRYFGEGVANHHRDEEIDLFPLLKANVAADERQCIDDLIARLAIEHDALETGWLTIRSAIEALAEGKTARLDVADAEALKAAYVAHIAVEEAELIPLAARVLAPPQIAALGRSMAARRQVA